MDIPRKFIYVYLVLYVFCTLVSFLAGETLIGVLGIVGFMVIVGGLTLAKLPMPMPSRFDLMTTLFIVAAVALPISISFGYDAIQDWVVGESTWWVIVAIVVRPIGRSVLELGLDRLWQSNKLRRLEELSGKLAKGAHELYQYSRSTAVAESVYSSLLIGLALMKVLPKLGLGQVEQQMTVLIVLSVSSVAICYLHPQQREIRYYLARMDCQRVA